jgi:hypothetical protein
MQHHGSAENKSHELIRKDYWDMVSRTNISETDTTSHFIALSSCGLSCIIFGVQVETSRLTATVEYGNDIDTLKFQSGFPVNT